MSASPPSSAIEISRPAGGDDDAFGLGKSGPSGGRRQHFLSRSPLKGSQGAPAQPSADQRAVRYLRSLPAVRERCAAVFEAFQKKGESEYFTLDRVMVDDIAAKVVEIGHRDYGTDAGIDPAKVPAHARWRHYAAGGPDRAEALISEWGAGSEVNTLEKTRRLVDLTVISVLVDAGAGPDWKYTEEGGKTYTRSEGLAVASVDMFRKGLFSSSSTSKHHVDAKALKSLQAQALAAAFQHSDSNPLVGLEGRHDLLKRLGEALESSPQFFDPAFGSPNPSPRPGNMVDYLLGKSERVGEISEYGTGGTVRISLKDLWEVLISGLGPVWPKTRTQVAGQPMGDVWPCALLGDGTEALVPFHKLTQWMAYSLVGVLERVARWEVADQELLTGLPEYRNGGIIVDYGLLMVKDPKLIEEPLDVGHPLIVEWRALTVALLDMIAERVRRYLRLTPEQLPLAKVLEMGTWKAGREEAARRREGGGPPIQIIR
ncbi:hypothetical protein DFJ74DRAFT_639823 [Hyaloraphidium curvatum]|nr:hypothetical protein DFJ74DRAFT_639823 [Hyaloraphidium curvatum]